MKKCMVAVILGGILLTFSVRAQIGNAVFGNVPDFSIQLDQEAGILRLNVFVPDDTHITDIKHGFFQVTLQENEYYRLADTRFPEGEPYADEMVFRGRFSVDLVLEELKPAAETVKLDFVVSFQVCREQPQEICLPPEETRLTVTIPAGFKPQEKSQPEPVESAEVSSPIQGTWMERAINRELGKGSFLLFLLVFLAGFLTSLTPCVYPVIPIVMGYMGTRSGGSKLKGFYLSLFFVLGMSLVYAVLGVIAASTGSMMGLSFQNPVVVIFVAAIFIAMGLSMAGLFDIPVPSKLSARLQGRHSSEWIGALLIGGVSGLVAAPCVGPVLIAMLSWISQTGNVFLGFWLTFVFSLGMGIIFILAGTFSGVLAALPRGGRWMEKIKHFFAFLLMAGGIYLISLLTLTWADLMLWGVFIITGTVFTGLFDPVDEMSVGSKLAKSLLLILFLIGALLLYRGITLHWFAPLTEAGSIMEPERRLTWYTDLEEGQAVALAQDRVVMIDAWAEWCTACDELEEKTFLHPDVRPLLDNLVLVKLDFTRKTPELVALRREMKIMGMPTVIFRSPDGSELGRFAGFKGPEGFIEMINQIKETGGRRQEAAGILN